MSDAATDCFPLTELYARLRGREDVMLIPHIGGGPARRPPPRPAPPAPPRPAAWTSAPSRAACRRGTPRASSASSTSIRHRLGGRATPTGSAPPRKTARRPGPARCTSRRRRPAPGLGTLSGGARRPPDTGAALVYLYGHL